MKVLGYYAFVVFYLVSCTVQAGTDLALGWVERNIMGTFIYSNRVGPSVLTDCAKEDSWNLEMQNRSTIDY